jgi:hypothetical protein
MCDGVYIARSSYVQKYISPNALHGARSLNVESCLSRVRINSRFFRETLGRYRISNLSINMPYGGRARDFPQNQQQRTLISSITF